MTNTSCEFVPVDPDRYRALVAAEGSHRWARIWKRAAKLYFEQYREAMRLKHHARQRAAEAESCAVAAEERAERLEAALRIAHRSLDLDIDVTDALEAIDAALAPVAPDDERRPSP